MAEQESNELNKDTRELAPHKTCRLCGGMGRVFLVDRTEKWKNYKCDACNYKWAEEVR